MIDRAFSHHRQAALALLSERSDFPHKTAGFLGHVCVAPVLSGRQRGWLAKELERSGLPRLAEGSAQ